MELKVASFWSEKRCHTLLSLKYVANIDFESHKGQVDKREKDARAALEEYFATHNDRVFFSKQLEVLHEDRWFHWITNRALHDLVDIGVVLRDVRPLASGGTVHVMWHRSYRYYRRAAAALVGLVEEYSDSNIGAALGLQGEALVLEGYWQPPRQ